MQHPSRTKQITLIELGNLSIDLMLNIKARFCVTSKQKQTNCYWIPILLRVFRHLVFPGVAVFVITLSLDCNHTDAAAQASPGQPDYWELGDPLKSDNIIIDFASGEQSREEAGWLVQKRTRMTESGRKYRSFSRSSKGAVSIQCLPILT